MSKRHKPPPFNLADYKAKKADEGAVRIHAGDLEFVVLPPELMDDKTYLKFIRLEQDPESLVDQARMLMGDRYDEFVAAGGSAILLLSMIAEASTERTDEQGADPGESEASSTS